MKRLYKFIPLLLVALLLSGCMLTVEEMYRIPKRSEAFTDLQNAFDEAMDELSFCAPLSGENLQAVQVADLDGNGVNEYLLYAKSDMEEKPLRVLVFQNVNGSYKNVDVVECNGTAFDQIEYVDMDGNGGVEILVGRQLSDQLIRSVTVYTFRDGELTQLASMNYTKYLTADLNMDDYGDLFILRPGQTDNDNGVAELYKMENSEIVRYNEVPMSQPLDNLKRVLIGKMQGGETAIYAASAAGEKALITDVFALKDETLKNISLSDGATTSVQTLRNFYIYADDIDDDAVVELPRLITMVQPSNTTDNHLLCWYSLTIDGEQSVKMYTYHNFVGGWYLQMGNDWAENASVSNNGNCYDFFVWDEASNNKIKLLSIIALSGQNRDEQSAEEGYVTLHKTDTVIYTALLSPYAKQYGYTEQTIKLAFRQIQQDWKTGETQEVIS